MANDLQTEHLRTLLEVAAQQSIRGAAHALGVSRPTIRRRLAQLEATIGTPLIERSDTHVELTPAGELVARHGRLLIRDAESMVEAARAASHPRPVFRMVVPVGMPPVFRSRNLVLFQQALPGMRWELVEAEDPLEWLNQPVDLVFHFGPSPEREEFYTRVVRRGRMVLVGTPSYLDRVGRPARLSDLADHPIACWHGHGSPAGVLQLADGGTHRFEPRLVSRSPLMLRNYAMVGGGLAYTPEGGDFDEAEIAPLEPLFADSVGTEMPFRLLMRRPSSARPGLRAALDQFKAIMDAAPPPEMRTD